MKIAFYTLGCKVNQYETEALRNLFIEDGWQIGKFSEPCDAYIINTCTVTEVSDKKSRQIIRRAALNNREAVIAVIGCYAQSKPKEIQAIKGVDIIIGTKNKMNAAALVAEACKEKKGMGAKNFVSPLNHFEPFEDTGVTAYSGRTRAIIKVQDGCNNFCSYCIIPYVRGPIRSRPLDDVYKECEALAHHGFSELVLSGIHICSYGRDLGNVALIDLLKRIHPIEGIKRIRLSSIEPTAFTASFLQELAALPKICDHFHISLQSGCDDTLKRMNRRYTSDEFREIIGKIKDVYKNAAITTDLITGFPGESEDEFQITKAFIRSLPLYHIHTFPYSKRSGTKAAEMEGHIPKDIKEARCREIIKISEEKERAFREGFLNSATDVLIEQKKDGIYIGHTTNYLKAEIKSNADLENKIVRVKITGVNENALMAAVLFPFPNGGSK